MKSFPPRLCHGPWRSFPSGRRDATAGRPPAPGYDDRCPGSEVTDAAGPGRSSRPVPTLGVAVADSADSPYRYTFTGGPVEVRGALDLEPTRAGVLPWRLPAWARRRFPDAMM